MFKMLLTMTSLMLSHQAPTSPSGYIEFRGAAMQFDCATDTQCEAIESELSTKFGCEYTATDEMWTCKRDQFYDGLDNYFRN